MVETSPRDAGLYLALGALAWVAAAAVLVAAAGPLAGARPLADLPALASHLAGLGALPLLVLGCAWSLVPSVFGSYPDPGRVRLALPLLAGAFLLAPGIAFSQAWLVAPGAAALAAGFVIVARELLAAARTGSRAGRGAPARTALRLAVLQVAVALVLGPLVFAHGDEPILGIPHERLVLLLPALAALGWLPLSLLALARTLLPRNRRIAALAPWTITAAAWLAVAGLAAGSPPAALAGAGLLALTLVTIAHGALSRGGGRSLATPAGVYAAVAGLALVQALTVGGLALAGATGSLRAAGPYAVLLLGGWAMAAAFSLVGTIVAVPRRRLALLAAGHLAGVELVAFGALAGSSGAALAGASVLLASAAGWAGACAGRMPLRARDACREPAVSTAPLA